MVLMARDISKQIEAELEYPGQIKVNVVQGIQSNRLRKINLQIIGVIYYLVLYINTFFFFAIMGYTLIYYSVKRFFDNLIFMINV